jgi:hypothetical protein
MREWIGDDFEPQRFSVDEINRRLRQLSGSTAMAAVMIGALINGQSSFACSGGFRLFSPRRNAQPGKPPREPGVECGYARFHLERHRADHSVDRPSDL